MAYTDSGVYYPTNGDQINNQSMFQQFAESIDGKMSTLQVVTATSTSTAELINSFNYLDSTLSATITPTSTSSKIIVLASVPFSSTVDTSTTSYSISWSQSTQELRRGGTAISSYMIGASGLSDGKWEPYGHTSELQYAETLNISYTDSPATTSPVTYNISGKIYNSLPTATYKRIAYGIGKIILMEVQ